MHTYSIQCHTQMQHTKEQHNTSKTLKQFSEFSKLTSGPLKYIFGPLN